MQLPILAWVGRKDFSFLNFFVLYILMNVKKNIEMAELVFGARLRFWSVPLSTSFNFTSSFFKSIEKIKTMVLPILL